MIDSRIRCGTAGEFDEDLTSAIGFLGSAPAVATRPPRLSYPDHALGWVGTISRSRRGEQASLLESYQSMGFVRRRSFAFFKSVGLISMRFLGLALANLSQVKQAVLIIGLGLRHS